MARNRHLQRQRLRSHRTQREHQPFSPVSGSVGTSSGCNSARYRTRRSGWRHWPAWIAASALTSTTTSGRTFGSGFFASRPPHRCELISPAKDVRRERDGASPSSVDWPVLRGTVRPTMTRSSPRYRPATTTSGSARYAAHPAQKRVAVTRAAPRAPEVGRTCRGGRARRCARTRATARGQGRCSPRHQPGTGGCSTS